MTLFKKLNSQGITIILVTHEADIAQYGRRLIRFLDGKIMSDEKTGNR
jgi:putative ABC transport system ATP-binding protein